MPLRLLNEKNTHLMFEVSLFFKGAFAAAEVLAGISAYFVTQQLLFKVVERLMRIELLEDPRDLIASYLLTAVDHFSLSTRNFTAAYLLSHGVIKLWLIVGLLRGKLRYYPLAIAIFGLFIAYQMYRFTLTHSSWLVLITVVDLIVIGLTWREYRYLRTRRGGLGMN
jgi:uncharacterized membrane protein